MRTNARRPFVLFVCAALAFVSTAPACGDDGPAKAPHSATTRTSGPTAASGAAPSGSPASSNVAAVASGSSSAATPPKPPDPTIVSTISIPMGLEAGKRYPFVLFLHGLGGTGRSFASALSVPKLSVERKFLYAAPDGAMDSKQRRFWNASSACCDFDHTGVDHVASLGAIIDTATRMPEVDPARVYVIGFSNGAFMAHRLGCSVKGITGIVSVAGSAPNAGDPPCAPPAPVAVLEIHGDADKAVSYLGGHVLDMQNIPAHRSVDDTMKVWATVDNCTGGATEKGRLDLMASLPGAETHDMRWSGCSAPVAHWRVSGGDHFIAASTGALDQMLTFLESASKDR